MYKKISALSALIMFSICSCYVQAVTKELQGEKPIVVVIPSYNNADWYQKNLDSVLSQNYDNFRVVYVDDASTDGTADLVEAYLQTHDIRGKVQLIRNKERRGMLENRYKAFHSVSADTIICELDGDDWYSGDDVLQRVNQEYQSPHTWLTFGQYKRMPSGRAGHSHPIAEHVLDNQVYRKDGYYTSMLRTYYAGLYQKIALKDFMYAGQPFPVCTDLAAMYPMIEMAGEHAHYIDDVLYIVNRYNALNTENIFTDAERRVFVRAIRQYKQTYERLETLDLQTPDLTKKTVKMVLFSHNSPQQLSQCIGSANMHMRGVDQISVIYHADASRSEAYADVQSLYPNVTFFRVPIEGPVSFAELVREVCGNHSHDYVLISGDDRLVEQGVRMHDCIASMAQTKAHGFYLSASRFKKRTWPERKALPYFITLRDRSQESSVYAWQFTGGQKEWLFPDNLDMTLYDRSTVVRQLAHMNFDSFATLAYVWSRLADLDDIGLCYGKAKVVKNDQAAPMHRFVWLDESYDNECAASCATGHGLLGSVFSLFSWLPNPFAHILPWF